MKLIGVELKTPSLKELFPVLAIGLFFTLICAALAADGAPWESCLSAASGGFGGLLAGAYGASVRTGGWRAALVCMLFGGGMGITARVLIALAS